VVDRLLLVQCADPVKRLAQGQDVGVLRLEVNRGTGAERRVEVADAVLDQVVRDRLRRLPVIGGADQREVRVGGVVARGDQAARADGQLPLGHRVRRCRRWA